MPKQFLLNLYVCTELVEVGVSLQFAGARSAGEKAPIYPEALFWENVNSLRQKT